MDLRLHFGTANGNRILNREEMLTNQPPSIQEDKEHKNGGGLLVYSVVNNLKQVT
jgi:hypothetical protein